MQHYIHKNEPMCSLTHGIGFVLSIAVLVVLIVVAAHVGTAGHVVGVTIFGSSLVLVYATSTLYHLAYVGTRLRRVFQRIDHSMIYILIAATYTPVSIAYLKGGWGWSLFGLIWGLAAVGILLKFVAPRLYGWRPALYYIAMGWLALVAFVPISQLFTPVQLALLVAGGIFYTVGVLFFALDHVVPRRRWFGMHEVFHLFVLAGSASHTWFMFSALLG